MWGLTCTRHLMDSAHRKCKANLRHRVWETQTTDRLVGWIVRQMALSLTPLRLIVSRRLSTHPWILSHIFSVALSPSLPLFSPFKSNCKPLEFTSSLWYLLWQLQPPLEVQTVILWVCVCVCVGDSQTGHELTHLWHRWGISSCLWLTENNHCCRGERSLHLVKC